MKQLLIDTLPTRLYLELKWQIYKKTTNENFDEVQSIRKSPSYCYSLKPFDDKQTIFVHIPKCAGVSVNKAIFGSLGGGHITLNKYLKIFEPECIVNYFKFTIVRNPWDRLVSAFLFLKKGGFNEQDRAWANKELKEFDDFDSFVRFWLNKKNIFSYHHFRPQYSYILDKHRKVPLDFIGFLENLEEDFEFIKQQVDVEGHLIHTNALDRSHYMDYYTDETKEIVANIYAEDICLLGYRFDNSSLDGQIQRRNKLVS